MSPALERQDTWSVAYTIDLGQPFQWIDPAIVDLTTGWVEARTITTRYATREGTIAGVPYQGRIIGVPVVSRRMQETGFGLVEVSDFEVVLSNPDAALDALYSDARWISITVTRHDLVGGVSTVLARGRVTYVGMDDGRFILRGSSLDPALFERILPPTPVATADFSRAIDIGATPPIIMGNARRVRLPYVNDDKPNSVFDYLVSYSSGHSALTLGQLYQVGPLDRLFPVPSSEYTLSSSLYSGYWAIRSTKRYVTPSGDFYPLYADIVYPTDGTERNFATWLGRLLSDTTWGLGQTINAASFTSAAAALNAAGPFYCDGAVRRAQQAQDIIRHLTVVRGLRLALNASGEWTVTVDSDQAASVRLERGPGTKERNLLSVGTRERKPAPEAVRTLRLRYDWHGIREEFQFEVSRVVHGNIGRDQFVGGTDGNPFIVEWDTADRVVDYQGKLEFYGDDVLPATASQEARSLLEGDVVTVTDASRALSSATMRVIAVTPLGDGIQLRLRGHGAAIYTYDPGETPPVALSDVADTFGPGVLEQSITKTISASTTTAFTFAHSLGRLPASVMVQIDQAAATAGVVLSSVEPTETDVTVRLRNLSGGSVTVTATLKFW